jgi:hypothetical protein
MAMVLTTRKSGKLGRNHDPVLIPIRALPLTRRGQAKGRGPGNTRGR